MQTLALLKKLIAFKTTADNSKELERIVGFCNSYLKNSNLFLKKFRINGKPSLFACTGKTIKPAILFLQHLDVVPAHSQEQFKPKIVGNKLYARGAFDNKSECAIVLNLLKWVPKHYSVGALFTTDEETRGKDGAGFFARKGFAAKKLLICLDGGNLSNLVIQEKGLMTLSITARGKSCHGAMPWKGENAIEKLIAAFPKIKKLFPKSSFKSNWKETMNLGMISAGKAVNIVPDFAEMKLDVRFTDERKAKSILKKMRRIKGIKVKVLERGNLLSSSSKNPLVKLLKNSIEEAVGKKVSFKKEHGASDARYFSARMPCVLFSSFGRHVHSKNEFVEIDSIEKTELALRKFLQKVFEKGN